VNARVREFLEAYAGELGRFQRKGEPADLDKFLEHSPLKWSRNLKRHFRSGDLTELDSANLRRVIYRPFTAQYLYLSDIVVDEPSRTAEFFPKSEDSTANRMLVVTDLAGRSPFSVLATSIPADLHLCASADGFQCFPFYTYAEDGTNRRENITDWALEQFRSHYHDPSITKWDIFHYIYAVLHHPEYRERYAANLRRELPRIPFVGNDVTPSSASSSPGGAADNSPGRKSGVETKKENNSTLPKAVAGERSSEATGASTDDRSYEKLTGEAKGKFLSEWKAEQDAGQLHYASQDDARLFHAFAKAGQRLAEIHVHYEQQPEYKLTKVEKAGEKLDYRVTKMKLSKDKTTLIYNQFLTLSGIPKETYEYRLGNRSALEWVIDQYQVSTDKRSGITNDPNRPDDSQYILHLIGQVVTVSLETVKLVRSLPPLGLPA
jgi:predicted helicase